MTPQKKPRLYRSICQLLMAIVLTLVYVHENSADIVAVTDPNFGGGVNNVTGDTATGLEWLDWDVSANFSYNEIIPLLGPGQALEGWRYATVDEVGTFFDHLGLPVDG